MLPYGESQCRKASAARDVGANQSRPKHLPLRCFVPAEEFGYRIPKRDAARWCPRSITIRKLSAVFIHADTTKRLRFACCCVGLLPCPACPWPSRRFPHNLQDLISSATPRSLAGIVLNYHPFIVPSRSDQPTHIYLSTHVSPLNHLQPNATRAS